MSTNIRIFKYFGPQINICIPIRTFLTFQYIFEYSPYDQNILEIFFSPLIFPKLLSFKCTFFIFFVLGLEYSIIRSNFGLKYIRIFVCEDFNLSNIFAYSFEKALFF